MNPRAAASRGYAASISREAKPGSLSEGRVLNMVRKDSAPVSARDKSAIGRAKLGLSTLHLTLDGTDGGYAIARLFELAGLPNGTLTVVPGASRPARLTARAENLHFGDPDTNMVHRGPIINEKQANYCRCLVNKRLKRAATKTGILVGAQRTMACTDRYLSALVRRACAWPSMRTAASGVGGRPTWLRSICSAGRRKRKPAE